MLRYLTYAVTLAAFALAVASAGLAVWDPVMLILTGVSAVAFAAFGMLSLAVSTAASDDVELVVVSHR